MITKLYPLILALAIVFPALAFQATDILLIDDCTGDTCLSTRGAFAKVETTMTRGEFGSYTYFWQFIPVTGALGDVLIKSVDGTCLRIISDHVVLKNWVYADGYQDPVGVSCIDSGPQKGNILLQFDGPEPTAVIQWEIGCEPGRFNIEASSQDEMGNTYVSTGQVWAPSCQ